MFTMQHSMWTTILLHLLAMSTLSQFPTLITSAKLTQLTLNLTHNLPPNSSISAFFPQRYENMSPEEIRIPVTRYPDFKLLVQLSLGTPPIRMNLLLDTGSALTWAQCKPCKICYTQKYSLYDSTDTKTFQKLKCDNPICKKAQYKCDNQNQCAYSVAYSGGMVVKGIASTETFYFSNGAVSKPNVVFGCSNETYNAGQLERNGNIAGIMGLNRAPHSLLNQLLLEQKRKFSYCFAPFGSGSQVGNTTVLRFGDDVPTITPTLKTPFRTGFSNYHLQLVDISVGNRRLGLPAGTFAPTPKGDGGIIIDSSTLLPQIEKKGWFGKPYSTVMSAFKQYYSALRLQKIKTPSGLTLDLCYRKPAYFSKFASMTYHFKDADYVVDGKYTSYVDFDERAEPYFCVALLPGKGVSVLGTWHQQNVRLVYDVSMGVLRFGGEDCAKDRA